MKILGDTTEPAIYQRAESAVRAQVNESKLIGWLSMNVTLTILALLVAIAQRTVETKPIRSTALAAMTLDLSEVLNSGRADGLCNAVTLSAADKRLLASYSNAISSRSVISKEASLL